MEKVVIKTSLIKNAVKLLCEQANYHLPEDVFEELKSLYFQEESETSKRLIYDILLNAQLASKSKRPMCQDTGLAVIFIDIGQDITLEGEFIEDAINHGVEEAYKEGFLRKSVVNNPPFERTNTGNNTPAIIHTKIVPGNEIKLTVAPKGGGSENMSTVKMLKPADGEEGIINFVVETVINAGANPCPPINVGIGIGGTMEQAAILSKKALLKKIISQEELEKNAQKDKTAALELKILNKINNSGIGTQGIGGIKTAFGVNIEMMPCHIASLPVAVNINCHAARHAEIILNKNTIIPEETKQTFDMILPEMKNTDLIPKKINLPLDKKDIETLKAGDYVLLNGTIYTGRDAAHKNLINCLNKNEELPVDLKGQTIYYVGPCPAKENEVIGSAGPTTSGRMDSYTPAMLKYGLKGMIGKGYRNEAVIEAIKKEKAIYFIATGGAGSLLSTKIKKAEVVAYPELGPEAIYKLEIEDFPVIVCIDTKGNNLYESGKAKYKK